MREEVIVEALTLQQVGRAVCLMTAGNWSGLADEQEEFIDGIAKKLQDGDEFTLLMRADLSGHITSAHVFNLISSYVRQLMG